MMGENELVTNAVLGNKIENLTVQVTKLELAISSAATTFVTRDVFELRMREFDLMIKTIDTNQASINSKIMSMSRRNWIQNSLSAMVGVIFTGLVSLLVYLLANKA